MVKLEEKSRTKFLGGEIKGSRKIDAHGTKNNFYDECLLFAEKENQVCAGSSWHCPCQVIKAVFLLLVQEKR